MAGNKKIQVAAAFRKLKGVELNSVIAYAASMMLNGVPPAVCESVLLEVYCSVKKSIDSIIH